MAQKNLFAGRHVLIVEDEYFLADDTRKKLIDLDAVVVGPTATVAEALSLIKAHRIDGAILDVHLGDELVFPVAEELDDRNVPFVFASGYDPFVVPGRFSGFVLCAKPAELEKIGIALFGQSGNDLN